MGKNKYIETPEKMYELFTKYKESINNSSEWEKVQYVGKDGDRVADALKPPYTMEGFEIFVVDNTEVTYPDLTEYFEGKNESYKDYFPICSRIRNEIRANQITGGMLGFYNPSITQRLNGLTEKKETILKGSINIPNLPDIGNRE